MKKQVMRIISFFMVCAILAGLIVLPGTVVPVSAEAASTGAPVEIVGTEKPETAPVESESAEPTAPALADEEGEHPVMGDQAAQDEIPESETVEVETDMVEDAQDAQDTQKPQETSNKEVISNVITRDTRSTGSGEMLVPAGFKMYRHYKVLNVLDEIGVAEDFEFHLKYVIENGKQHPAYCIYPAKESGTGLEGSIATGDVTLDEVWWGTKRYGTINGERAYMTDAQRREIMLILAYADMLGNRNIYDEMAVQMAIWDVLGRYRKDSDFSVKPENQSAYADGWTMMANNFMYLSGTTSHLIDYGTSVNGSWVWHGKNAVSISQLANARQRYQDIVTLVANHLQGKTLPSFATSSTSEAEKRSHTYTMTLSNGLYVIELTDENGALQYYDFTTQNLPSGVTVTRVGNTLRITATPAARTALNRFTFQARGSALPDSVVDYSGVLIFTPDEKAVQPTVSYIGTTPDPITARFWLLAPLTPPKMTLTKTVVGGGQLAGYRFNLNKPHWGTLRLTSDANGRLYKTGSNPAQYEFTNISNGRYIMREYSHDDDTALKQVNVTVRNNSGDITYQKSFNKISHLENGDSIITTYPIVIDTVSDGSKVEIEFVNAPMRTLKIKKVIAAGSTGSWDVNGFEFHVSKLDELTGLFEDLGTYFTENDGTEDGVISIPKLFVGDKLLIEEIVPDGWTCGAPNPKAITITSEGANTVTFTNTPPAAQAKVKKTSDDDFVAGIPFRVSVSSSRNGPWTLKEERITTNAQGEFSVAGNPGQWLKIEEISDDPLLLDYVCEEPKIVQLVSNQTVSVTFHNSLSAYVDLIKTAPVSEGYLGVTFTFYDCDEYGQKFSNTPIYTAQTESYEGDNGDTYGRILTPKIFTVGQYVLVEETVPQGFSSGLTNDSVVIGPLVKGVNAIDFENTPVFTLKIQKTSDDYDPNAEYDEYNPNPIAGITFDVYYVKSSGGEEIVTSVVTDENGEFVFNTGDGSLFFFGSTYRIVERPKQGYTADPASQTITIGIGDNVVHFTNHPITALKIKKTSEDGQVSGLTFTVSKIVNNAAVSSQDYITNANGEIDVPNISWGDEYEIYEHPVSGMVVSGDNPRRVTINQLGTTVVDFLNVSSGALTIKKRSPDGNVDNWEFLVERKSGNSYVTVGTYSTGIGNNGNIVIPDVVVGETYRITEIQRSGYEAVSPRTITIREGDNTIMFLNTPLNTLIIKKECADGNISNIPFDVYKMTNSGWRAVGFFYTDSNGLINVPNLAYGTKLKIQENWHFGSENYIIPEEPQIVTIIERVTTVTFVNIPKTSLTLTKTSSDGNVGNIYFNVERWVESDDPREQGSFVPWSRVKTNSYGKINFDTIPGYEQLYGVTLRFTEEVPEGYIASPESQTITVQAGTNSVNFTNTRIVGNVYVIKKDPNGQNLQGAEFSLYKEDGTLYSSKTTNSAGSASFLNVPYGRYTLVETAAPNGFALDPTEYSVVISEMDQVMRYTFENRYAEGQLKVFKVDETGAPISGVKFLLEYANVPDTGRTPRFTPVASRISGTRPTIGGCTSEGLTNGMLITGEDGTADFTGLYIGSNTSGQRIRYRISEVNAPAGFEPVTGYVYEGYLFNETSEVFVNVENVRIKGSLRIIKVDETDETQLLNGAGFNLYNEDMELIASGITENGQIEFRDLPYGTYYYQEYQPPEGYVLDNTIYEFAIETQGQVVEHTRVNRQDDSETGSIIIYKHDPSNRLLSGVTFRMEYSLDGTAWQPVRYSEEIVAPGNCSSEGLTQNGELTTDETGMVTFAGLFVGSADNQIYYRITETATVSGLSLLSGPVFIGTISAEETPNIVIHAYNDHTFVLPHTGATGTHIALYAGLLICSALILLWTTVGKKRAYKYK